MSNVACRGRRAGRGTSLPLGTDAVTSTFSADVLTVNADNTAVATFTVLSKTSTNTPKVGAVVVASTTNAANSTLSAPAVTDANGSTTFTLKASTAATRVVTVTVDGVPIPTSVSIVFSSASVIDRTTSTVSLQAASANAGDPAITVTLQGKDATSANMTTGGSTVVFGSAGGTSVITISATTDVTNGTYTATITPVTAGTATTLTCTIGGQAVTTSMPTFTVTSSSFAAGNILDNFGFESASWGFFRSGNAGTPTGNRSDAVSLDTQPPVAMTGTYSAKRTFAVSDNTDSSPQVFLPFGRPSTAPWSMMTNAGNQGGATGLDRLYSRFDVVFDNAPGPGTINKFQIYEDYSIGQYQYGGIYLHTNKVRWFFTENILTGTGTASILMSQASLCDGAKHTFEVDYWLNGDTSYDSLNRPSVQIWFDGTALTPSDTSDHVSPSSGVTYWSRNVLSNGRIYSVATGFANEGHIRYYPTTRQLGTWNMMGVCNANSNSTLAHVWIDRVSVSTNGRVGP